MEERQEVKKGKRWLWAPIGVIVLFLVACALNMKMSEPALSYKFLKGAEKFESDVMFTQGEGSPVVYIFRAKYRLTTSSDNLKQIIEKELESDGWTRSFGGGILPTWSRDNQTLRLTPGEDGSQPEIHTWSHEQSTPLLKFQAWVGRQLGKGPKELHP